MELNRNVEERDMLVHGKSVEKGSFGGITHYGGLTLETLKTLIEKGYADPEDQQNDAPNIAEILSFMERHPEFTAHGYTVVAERDDYRVSIEGVEHKGFIDAETQRDFVRMFRHADDFVLNPDVQYCWFD